MDLYRAMIRLHGKAKFWSLGNDEVCEAIEEMLNSIGEEV